MSKFKIIKDRESLSSEEIAKQMNFNNFIAGYTAATNVFLSIKAWFILGGVSIAAVVFTIIILQSHSRKITASTEPFILPPLPQLYIAPTTWMVSGNNDTIINYPGGTKLFIPANAFAYSDNKPATGPFKIQFREFNDQVDQMLSGIPMLYDSAGVKKQFESAGMFDIMAYENKTPVFIKKGKELIVDMQSCNLDNNFNVYYLDTIQRQWIYDKDNSENNTLLIASIDTVLQRKFQINFKAMVLPKKADPLLDNLLIDFNEEDFPELAIFDNVKFQFNNKKKNSDVGSNKTWDDVKITRQDSKHYFVTFLKGKFKQSFLTTPVLDEKDFNRAYAEYDKVRTIRISKFKNVADSLNNLRDRYDNQQMRHLMNSNQRINNLIHNGDFQNAINNYVDAQSIYLMSKQTHGISRMIAVRKFGIFNNDRPIQYFYANAFSDMKLNKVHEKKEILPKAHYYNEKNNAELTIEKAYLIKRSFNGTFTLSKENISKFPVNEGKASDILVVVTTKKELLFIKDKEFKATDFSRSDVAFRMHTISKNLKMAEEIKNYLDL